MNSELYDKKYPIPLPLIKQLKAKLMANSNVVGDGVKRAKFLIYNGYATYQMMKRMKNFFDHFDRATDSVQEYELSGGMEMQNFIEHSLNTDRDGVNRSKELNRPTNPDMMQGMNTYNVTEGHLVGDSVNHGHIKRRKIEEEEEVKVEDNGDSGEDGDNGYDGDDEVGLDLNAVVVVVNEEQRFLLLKRSTYPDQWMPNKWSMAGGAIEKGESPEVAALRELKEETGISVDKFKESFVIQRGENVEHVFLSLFTGDPFNIKIDKENQGYGWFGYNEIKYLDTVPNLMDYINITLNTEE
jgi:8-oxo-dGTP pyrophosphatase MutT (NUDIX family)